MELNMKRYYGFDTSGNISYDFTVIGRILVTLSNGNVRFEGEVLMSLISIKLHEISNNIS